MPVRGSGWYKRPYRITYTRVETGRRVSLAFHWKGARDSEADWLRNHPAFAVDLKVWNTGEQPVASR